MRETLDSIHNRSSKKFSRVLNPKKLSPSPRTVYVSANDGEGWLYGYFLDPEASLQAVFFHEQLPPVVSLLLL